MSKKREKKRVHVFFTRSGLTLILIIVAMLMASMNYSNNMAYSLCFLLISLLLVSFIYTGNNLRGLEISNVQHKTTFAGGHVIFSAEIKNISSRKRHALFLTVRQKKWTEFFGPFSLDPHSSRVMEISIPSPHRGKFILPRISFISIYPMGLLYAYTHRDVQKEYIIFPKPLGLRPWPPAITLISESMKGSHSGGGEDFSGHRPYRKGESQHHIDWKAYARGRPLSIKEFTGGGSIQQWFDWAVLAGMDTEERLSQLTRWVLDADGFGIESIPTLDLRT